MATLRDLQRLMERSGVPSNTVSAIFAELQRSYPGESIYVPAPSHSKKEAILASARTLPSGVVAQRHGVTRSYVNMLIKKRN